MKNNIRMLRVWRNMTLLELAEASKCSEATLSLHERDKMTLPMKPELLSRVAHALDVDEQMVTEEITLIPKPWKRVYSDLRLSVLVEEMLTWSSGQIEAAYNKVVSRQEKRDGESN